MINMSKKAGGPDDEYLSKQLKRTRNAQDEIIEDFKAKACAELNWVNDWLKKEKQTETKQIQPSSDDHASSNDNDENNQGSFKKL